MRENEKDDKVSKHTKKVHDEMEISEETEKEHKLILISYECMTQYYG